MMHPIIKNLLGITIIATLGFGSYGLYSFSRSTKPSDYRSFDVNASAKVNAIPDIAQLNVGVLTEGGKDIAKLQKENTDKMDKIINYIKSLGIEDKDIKTINYNIYPKYNYPNCSEFKVCPPAEIVGYQISQNLALKIRDFSKIGIIMGEAVKNGANDVNGLSFAIEDPSNDQNKARNEAIAKATAKAKDMAKAGGFKLGKLLDIRENVAGSYVNYARMEISSYKMADSAGAAPIISAGSEEVEVSVTLQYEID